MVFSVSIESLGKLVQFPCLEPQFIFCLQSHWFFKQQYLLIIGRFFLWLCCRVCGFLVPWPGIEFWCSVVKVLSSSHWTTRKFSTHIFWTCYSIICLQVYMYALSLQVKHSLSSAIYLHNHPCFCIGKGLSDNFLFELRVFWEWKDILVMMIPGNRHE